MLEEGFVQGICTLLQESQLRRMELSNDFMIDLLLMHGSNRHDVGLLSTSDYIVEYNMVCCILLLLLPKYTVLLYFTLDCCN